MELFNKIKSVITEPREFFSQIGREKGIGPAFVYLLVLTIFSAVLSYIMMMLTGNLSAKIMYSMMGAGELAAYADPTLIYGNGLLLVLIIVGIGISLALSFVIAGILHVWILIFGGKNKYTETYKLYVYQATPRLILGWIPGLNMFMWIWQLVLLIIGTMEVHSIKKRTAILMYLIPVLIFIVIMIVSMVFFGMMMARMGGIPGLA